MKDRDGVEKNLHKMGQEWAKVKPVVLPLWKKLLRRPWSSHRWTDWRVEAARISPYWAGHVWVVESVGYLLVIAGLVSVAWGPEIVGYVGALSSSILD